MMSCAPLYSHLRPTTYASCLVDCILRATKTYAFINRLETATATSLFDRKPPVEHLQGGGTLRLRLGPSCFKALQLVSDNHCYRCPVQHGQESLYGGALRQTLLLQHQRYGTASQGKKASPETVIQQQQSIKKPATKRRKDAAEAANPQPKELRAATVAAAGKIGRNASHAFPKQSGPAPDAISKATADPQLCANGLPTRRKKKATQSSTVEAASSRTAAAFEQAEHNTDSSSSSSSSDEDDDAPVPVQQPVMTRTSPSQATSVYCDPLLDPFLVLPAEEGDGSPEQLPFTSKHQLPPTVAETVEYLQSVFNWTDDVQQGIEGTLTKVSIDFKQKVVDGWALDNAKKCIAALGAQQEFTVDVALLGRIISKYPAQIWFPVVEGPNWLSDRRMHLQQALNLSASQVTALIDSNPALLLASTAQLRSAAAYLATLIGDPEAPMAHLSAMLQDPELLMREGDVRYVVIWLRNRLNINFPEVKEWLKSYPCLVGYTQPQIDTYHDFLVHELGGKHTDVLAYPKLLTFDIIDTMGPRLYYAKRKGLTVVNPTDEQYESLRDGQATWLSLAVVPLPFLLEASEADLCQALRWDVAEWNSYKVAWQTVSGKFLASCLQGKKAYPVAKKKKGLRDMGLD